MIMAKEHVFSVNFFKKFLSKLGSVRVSYKAAEEFTVFIEDIARARTFGFAKDIQYLQSQNLALGATLQNAIGLDDHKVLNPEGLRFDNEFARHKILDAMGDMMVSGHNILGKYESFAGSHNLNYQLTSKLLSDSKNYELVTVEELQSIEFAKSFA